jgi:hypothetical protein
MYWQNPIIEVNYPAAVDPIADSLHKGRHCIFYNPAQDKNQIRTNQRLSDLCAWANSRIQSQGLAGFVQDTGNHYEIANLVKLNMWVDNLPRQGSIKPMLLQYVGNPLLESGTGESRLRALERIDSIQHVAAFISTHVRYHNQFSHLESVTSFARFAELCNAVEGQQFLFRLTDEQAPYGLDWYEYNSQLTSQVTPGQDYCVSAITGYLTQHPDTLFTPEWFDTLVDWDQYKNS